MRIGDPDEGHNFYESFSDLIFCTLVLFIVLILVLVLQVGKKSAILTAEQAAMLTRIEQLDAEAQTLEAQRQELLTLRGEMGLGWKAKLERDLREARERSLALGQQLDDLRAAAPDAAAVAAAEAAAGAAAVAADRRQTALAVAEAAGLNRFTGRTGVTSFCLAVDFSGGQVRYVPIPASVFSQAHSDRPDETAREASLRRQRVIGDATRGVPRFTLDQLGPLFASMTYRHPGDEREEGQVSVSYSLMSSMIASGWTDGSGELIALRIDDRTLTLAEEFGGLYELNVAAAHDVLAVRDRTPPGDPAGVPVVRFGEAPGRRVSMGGGSYSVEEAVALLAAFGDGGVIVEYVPSNPAGGGACPDWLVTRLLGPTGLTSNVPDPQALERLRRELEASTPVEG